VLPSGQTATFQAGLPAPQPIVIPTNGIIANPSATSAYEWIPTDYKNPYVESWNVSVQQALPAHFTLDAAYVGNHGVRTPSASNIKRPPPVVGLGTKGQPEYPERPPPPSIGRVSPPCTTRCKPSSIRRFTSGLLITTSYTWAQGNGLSG